MYLTVTQSAGSTIWCVTGKNNAPNASLSLSKSCIRLLKPVHRWSVAWLTNLKCLKHYIRDLYLSHYQLLAWMSWLQKRDKLLVYEFGEDLALATKLKWELLIGDKFLREKISQNKWGTEYPTMSAEILNMMHLS